MNRFSKFLITSIVMSILFVACAKKPLTLDENTSMKALLRASDDEIKELVLKEAAEKANMSAEDVTVDYILRDDNGEAIAVKLKLNEE